eukprot:gene9610-biopygen8429
MFPRGAIVPREHDFLRGTDGIEEDPREKRVADSDLERGCGAGEPVLVHAAGEVGLVGERGEQGRE